MKILTQHFKNLATGEIRSEDWIQFESQRSICREGYIRFNGLLGWFITNPMTPDKKMYADLLDQIKS